MLCIGINSHMIFPVHKNGQHSSSMPVCVCRRGSEFLSDGRRSLGSSDPEDVSQRTARAVAYLPAVQRHCQLPQWEHKHTIPLNTKSLTKHFFACKCFTPRSVTQTYSVFIVWNQMLTTTLRQKGFRTCWCHFLTRTMHHCASLYSSLLR